MRISVPFLYNLFVGLPSLLLAQISFDFANSNWEGAGTFGGSATAGQTAGGSPAYYGGATTGTVYSLGFVNTAGLPSATSDYDLSATDLTAGTSLSLQFTGVTSQPSYIAYTGGALTGYSFNSGTGTLSLTASTVNPAASASDTAGSTLGSAFGLIIETDTASSNFQGTVFRTDGFWGDLAGLNTGYAGTQPLAGVNFNGEAGQNVNFDAHLTVDYLASIGINSPAQCMAYLQKAGTSEDQALAVTRELFGYSGVDPSLAGGGYSFGGDSTFDFDGDGSDDNYLIANYSNSSWSEGNIGIVPEPALTAFLSGFLALTFLLARRPRKIG